MITLPVPPSDFSAPSSTFTFSVTLPSAPAATFSSVQVTVWVFSSYAPSGSEPAYSTCSSSLSLTVTVASLAL